MSQGYQRPLPLLDDLNRPFWQGGKDGRLMIQRCEDCGFWLHPPQPVCARCLSRNLSAQPVSGKGSVYSYSVNVQQWGPGLETPYVIVIVELDEQPRLCMSSNLINIDPWQVRIGQRVEVVFQQDEDVWLPLFQPQAAG